MTTTTTDRPLATSYMAAHAAAVVADTTYQDCRCPACTDPAADATDCAAYVECSTAERTEDAARTAWLDSDETRDWRIADDGCWQREQHAPSEIDDALAEWARSYDATDRTITVAVWAWQIDPVTDEKIDDTRVSFDTTIDPEEPTCDEDRDGGVHDWQGRSISGNGGGVRAVHTCIACGLRRATNTWATDSRGAVYASVQYGDDEDQS